MGADERWTDHERRKHSMNANRHKANIIKKAMREGLEISKVKVAVGLTRAEAAEIERAFIKAIGREDGGGLLTNRTDGGDSPADFTPEQKAAISAKISKALRGKKKTPEHAAAAWATRRMRPMSDKQKGHLERLCAANRGRKHSKEAKKKIGLAHRGRPHSFEQVAKWKAAMQMGYWSEDQTEARARDRIAASER